MRDGLEQRNITLKFNATWKEYTISPRIENACSWNENSNRTVARMCPKKIFTITTLMIISVKLEERIFRFRTSVLISYPFSLVRGKIGKIRILMGINGERNLVALSVLRDSTRVRAENILNPW